MILRTPAAEPEEFFSSQSIPADLSCRSSIGRSSPLGNLSPRRIHNHGTTAFAPFPVNSPPPICDSDHQSVQRKKSSRWSEHAMWRPGEESMLPNSSNTALFSSTSRSDPFELLNYGPLAREAASDVVFDLSLESSNGSNLSQLTSDTNSNCGTQFSQQPAFPVHVPAQHSRRISPPRNFGRWGSPASVSAEEVALTEKPNNSRICQSSWKTNRSFSERNNPRANQVTQNRLAQDPPSAHLTGNSNHFMHQKTPDAEPPVHQRVGRRIGDANQKLSGLPMYSALI
eukprot:Selendium_serpulae@DN10089_c0_g1_i1.p1